MREIRLKARVQKGNRIDITAPGLVEGQEVELIVRTRGVADDSNNAPTTRTGDVLKYIDSLPPSTRTPQEWIELEREFQRERNAWDQ